MPDEIQRWRPSAKGFPLLIWIDISDFSSRPLPDVVALLQPLGIELRPARGMASYEQDPATRAVVKQIGQLAVTPAGVIRAYPVLDLMDTELRALLGSAEEAFRNPPKGSTHWYRRTRRGQTWWWCTVLIAADTAWDAVAAYVALDLTERRRRSLFEQQVMEAVEQ